MMKKYDPHSSFFITANHTGAGKTMISALVCRQYGQQYFKPVESGTPGDSVIIKNIGGDVEVVPPLYSYKEEEPPHYLAALKRETISIDKIISKIPKGPVILESAGGWFSPLNETETMADLARAAGLPVLAVFRAYLGSISHAVLTLEAILKTNVRLAGYIINGDDRYGMRRFLERRFPEVRCVAELPELARPEQLPPDFRLEL